MSVDTFEETIDGIAFRVTLLNGGPAVRMNLRLAAIVGEPVIAGVAMGLGEGNRDLISAGAAFFMRLTPAEYESIWKELLATAKIKVGDKWLPYVEQMELEMRGRVLTHHKLLLFALRKNFGDFIDALVGNELFKKLSGASRLVISEILARNGASGASSSDAAQP